MSKLSVVRAVFESMPVIKVVGVVERTDFTKANPAYGHKITFYIYAQGLPLTETEELLRSQIWSTTVLDPQILEEEECEPEPFRSLSFSEKIGERTIHHETILTIDDPPFAAGFKDGRQMVENKRFDIFRFIGVLLFPTLEAAVKAYEAKKSACALTTSRAITSLTG